MTSIINSTVPEFKVQAYHNGKFVTVTNEDLKGKWAIFFFYPADYTFVAGDSGELSPVGVIEERYGDPPVFARGRKDILPRDLGIRVARPLRPRPASGGG